MKVDVSELPLKDCAQLVAESEWFFELSRKEGVNGRVLLVASRVGGFEAQSPQSMTVLLGLPTIQFDEVESK